jgi:hypothetical protein
MKAQVEQAEQRGGIIAFRAPAELVAEVEAAAAAEGISRSDVARREETNDIAELDDMLQRLRATDTARCIARAVWRANRYYRKATCIAN